jgi:hypothetical protein
VRCERYGAPEIAGPVAEPALVELSGLAASARNAGLLYAHNDSGDTARFFALDTRGAARGEFVLRGATAADWEDIAVGPCPQGSCVYIADTGLASPARREFAIYRVPEPFVVAAGTTPREVPFELFRFAYPDHPRDAETLLVDPGSGAVYILGKHFGSGLLFRVPLEAGAVSTAVLAGEVRVPGGWLRLWTGGSVAPCGGAVLLRTYDRLFEYRAAPGAGVEETLRATPREVPVARELQGEAAAYAPGSLGYYTAGEGAGTTLHHVGCP